MVKEYGMLPLLPCIIPTKHLPHISEQSPSSSLAVTSVLLSLSLAQQCHAEEVPAALQSAETPAVVPAVASPGLPLGLEPSEIVLLLTPLIGYGIYKLIVIPKVNTVFQGLNLSGWNQAVLETSKLMHLITTCFSLHMLALILIHCSLLPAEPEGNFQRLAIDS
jgi:hypothetical protein